MRAASRSSRRKGARAGYLAFRTDRDRYEVAKELLTREGVPFEEQDHGTSHSIYFADPDGVRLEVTTYEV